MPIDNGDGTFDYTSDYQGGLLTQPAADLYPTQNTFGQTSNETTNPFYTYVNNFQSVNDLAGAAVTNYGGVADGAGQSWFDKTFGEAVKWFDSKSDKTQGAILGIGGSFLQGLFGARAKRKQIEAMTRSSEAAMLNAQTNAKAQADKTAQAAASQVSGTTFGAKAAAPQFKDLFEARRKRAGYQGA